MAINKRNPKFAGFDGWKNILCTSSWINTNDSDAVKQTPNVLARAQGPAKKTTDNFWRPTLNHTTWKKPTSIHTRPTHRESTNKRANKPQQQNHLHYHRPRKQSPKLLQHKRNLSIPPVNSSPRICGWQLVWPTQATFRRARSLSKVKPTSYPSVLLKPSPMTE